MMPRETTTLARVIEFHNAFGIENGQGVTAETLILRTRLISEEYKEVVEAAADVHASLLDVQRSPKDIPAVLLLKERKEALLKELIDLQYVLDGTFAVLGFDKQSAFNRVHESNMSKLGDDGKPVYREDGKVLKGPNYKEPDLSGLV